jgi:transposase
VYEDTATVLFGMPGVRVVEVETERDGVTTVYVVTVDPSRSVCPDCGCSPERVREDVSARLRDVPFGDRRIRVVWCKRRWVCPSSSCRRVTFTESLPNLRLRARLTTRLRRALVVGVADGGGRWPRSPKPMVFRGIPSITRSLMRWIRGWASNRGP